MIITVLVLLSMLSLLSPGSAWAEYPWASCQTDSCLYERNRKYFKDFDPLTKDILCSQKENDYIQFNESPECDAWRAKRAKELNPKKKPPQSPAPAPAPEKMDYDIDDEEYLESGKKFGRLFIQKKI